MKPHDAIETTDPASHSYAEDECRRFLIISQHRSYQNLPKSHCTEKLRSWKKNSARLQLGCFKGVCYNVSQKCFFLYKKKHFTDLAVTFLILGVMSWNFVGVFGNIFPIDFELQKCWRGFLQISTSAFGYNKNPKSKSWNFVLEISNIYFILW